MASGSIGSIFVDLLMRTGLFEDGLKKSKQSVQTAGDSWRRSLNSSQRDFQRFSNSIRDSIIPSIRDVGVAVAGALAVRRIVNYSDAWKNLGARLDLVTNSAQEMASIQQQLFEIAQQTGQPLNESISAYTKLNQSLTDAQKNSTDLVRLTELLSKTLLISGTTASGAATFFQQFAQAASSDFKAIGQELQTFADQNPILYRILQDEARRYGKTLKQMATDGELSFEFFTTAVERNQKAIDDAAATIPTTIGRAIQNLDNAFLKYIGTSDAVSKSTSSVAIIIQSLANNFDVLAQISLGVAGILAGRVVASLLSVGNAAKTVASLIGLLGGGPVGFAITGTIAAFTALSVLTDDNDQKQRQFNETYKKFADLNKEIANSNGEVRRSHIANRQAILDEAAANLKNAEARLQALKATVPNFSVFGMFAGGFGKLQQGIQSKEVEEYRKQLQALQVEIERSDNQVIKRDPVMQDPKAAKKRADELANSYQNLRTYIQGVTKETLKYEDTYRELEELLGAGLITDGEFQTAIGNLTKELNDNKEQFMLWGIDVSEVGKDAANNIKDYFADFLFDPFENGLDGMAKGFVDTMRRMVAEAQAAELTKAIFGKLGGGEGGGFFSSILGSLGGSLGSIFGSQGAIARGFAGVPVGPLPAFADGGYLGPGQFGIAGEAGAELIYGGRNGMTITPSNGKGGNTYYIDATGADPSTLVRIEKTMLALAGPGVIEKRVGQAQARGAI